MTRIARLRMRLFVALARIVRKRERRRDPWAGVCPNGIKRERGA